MAVTGKTYDHRKQWIEDELQKLAGAMGIDLLGFSILSNHFHLILRSRPDVVALWDDTEVARRWPLACPRRKNEDGLAAEPIECELNSIRHDPDRLAQIRSPLSDISWWLRLLCQTIAMRANREDGETGKFWQERKRASGQAGLKDGQVCWSNGREIGVTVRCGGGRGWWNLFRSCFRPGRFLVEGRTGSNA
jgi:hypothetical protein